MSKLKINQIVMCLSEALIGFLLIIDPIGFTNGIIITLGVVLAIMGVGNIVTYFREKPEEAEKNNKLAKGFLAVSIACVCVFKSEWFLAAFPVITVFYGVLIFVFSIGKIQWAVDMMRRKQKYWFIALIGAALSLVFAVLVVMNPFSSTAFLWIFIAVSLIVEAIIDIIAMIFEY